MAYCTADDVTPLIGDLELPSSIDVDAFVSKAGVDIDLALGRRYTVPIITADYFTQQLLLTTNAELAASQMLMSLAQGGEDNRVNAYAMHLYKRAADRLEPYFSDLLLPGTDLRDITAPGSLGPVAIYHEDATSPLESYYRWVQDPYSIPWNWPSGSLRG